AHGASHRDRASPTKPSSALPPLFRDICPLDTVGGPDLKRLADPEQRGHGGRLEVATGLADDRPARNESCSWVSPAFSRACLNSSPMGRHWHPGLVTFEREVGRSQRVLAGCVPFGRREEGRSRLARELRAGFGLPPRDVISLSESSSRGDSGPVA